MTDNATAPCVDCGLDGLRGYHTPRTDHPAREDGYHPYRLPVLTRQRSIFRLIGSVPGAPPDTVSYVHTLTDDGDPAPTVRTLPILTQDFEDMGRPLTLTVTVEPGDALNDLAGARDRVQYAKADLLSQVAEARRNGQSWADVGAVFGISRQAAWERFADSVPYGVAILTDD